MKNVEAALVDDDRAVALGCSEWSGVREQSIGARSPHSVPLEVSDDGRRQPDRRVEVRHFSDPTGVVAAFACRERNNLEREREEWSGKRKKLWLDDWRWRLDFYYSVLSNCIGCLSTRIGKRDRDFFVNSQSNWASLNTLGPTQTLSAPGPFVCAFACFSNGQW